MGKRQTQLRSKKNANVQRSEEGCRGLTAGRGRDQGCFLKRDRKVEFVQVPVESLWVILIRWLT